MPEKIFVRGVNWIGDAVMTMPALRSLRKAFPGVHISLLVKPSVSPIFEKDPAIDEVIVYEDRFRGMIGKLRLAYLLRKKGFSRAILLQNAFDAALIAFMAGISERTGYARDGRKFLLTKPIAFNNEDKKVHHIKYYLNLLMASGIPAEQSRPWIYLSLGERIAARDQLSGLKRPLLGINPGAAYGSAKRWFPERFAEVAGWFIKDTRGSVVIFGGEAEADVAEEIGKKVMAIERDFSDDSFLNLAGKTSLRQFIALISECDVILCNDSGPMHLSYALEVPLVVLFGSTDPVLTGPPEGCGVLIRHDFECSPCFDRTCKTNDLRCMYAITSDEVYLAIKGLIPSRPAVFLDRDGTLCEDVNYLSRWEDFTVLPGVDDLVKLKGKGYKLLGVTNQSGIARGLIDEGFVKEVNALFVDRFGFDDFQYCSHLPEEHCSCRKPEPGMLYALRCKHGIDLKRSYMIGDKEIDMMLAKSVGAKGILVTTGKDKESQYANFIVNNLREAISLVELETRT